MPQSVDPVFSTFEATCLHVCSINDVFSFNLTPFQPILDKFNKEQDAFIKSQGGADSGVAPWIGHQAEEKIKEEIMALSAVSFPRSFFYLQIKIKTNKNPIFPFPANSKKNSN